MVHTLRLLISNAFLIRGARPILVDTGSPGEEQRILRRLRRLGVAPEDLALILLTHGHSDHAGSAQALRKLTGAPIAAHPADAAMLSRGRNDPLIPLRLSARLLRRFVDVGFTPCEPDLSLCEHWSLASYGVVGRVIETPGHTPGSVTVLLDDGAAIAGDALMGGFAGGYLWSSRPRLPYYATDRQQMQASQRKLAAAAPKTVYVGHGGPLRGDDVARRFG